MIFLDTFTSFTDWVVFHPGSTQGNNVGNLGSGDILKILEHLGLVGVLYLYPLPLCVISGRGIQINLKNAGDVYAVRAILRDVDAAAGAEGYKDLVLVCGIVM